MLNITYTLTCDLCRCGTTLLSPDEIPAGWSRNTRGDRCNRDHCVEAALSLARDQEIAAAAANAQATAAKAIESARVKALTKTAADYGLIDIEINKTGP